MVESYLLWLVVLSHSSQFIEFGGKDISLVFNRKSIVSISQCVIKF